MTGRTHELAAFTALAGTIALVPLTKLSLATAMVAFSANMIGGLMPDIDQPTADLWHKLPAGGLYSRLITPLLGGHRYISHSILGFALFSFLSYYLLQATSHVLIVDSHLVWWSFLIGYGSHLIMDTLTKEGVPWLFPIPIRFGLPPMKIFRVRTGGLVEKFLIFPGLIIINVYLVYAYHNKFLQLLHHYIR